MPLMLRQPNTGNQIPVIACQLPFKLRSHKSGRPLWAASTWLGRFCAKRVYSWDLGWFFKNYFLLILVSPSGLTKFLPDVLCCLISKFLVPKDSRVPCWLVFKNQKVSSLFPTQLQSALGTLFSVLPTYTGHFMWLGPWLGAVPGGLPAVTGRRRLLLGLEGPSAPQALGRACGCWL